MAVPFSSKPIHPYVRMHAHTHTHTCMHACMHPAHQGESKFVGSTTDDGALTPPLMETDGGGAFTFYSVERPRVLLEWLGAACTR